jgi:hypothetical protein
LGGRTMSCCWEWMPSDKNLFRVYEKYLLTLRSL